MAAATSVVMHRPERTSDRAGAEAPTGQWKGRPVAAAALKLSLLLVPLLAAVAATRLVYALVGPAQTRGEQIALWSALLVTGFVVAVGVERVTRRFLPVTMLMRLTLVFPDQAPSRFKVMRAAASPTRLQEIARSRSEASLAAGQVLQLVSDLARHDRHTRGHSERVRVFADLIAEQMGITGLDRDKLRWSALLHDVGKLDVPAAILNKPGRPSPAEWALLQQHPACGEFRTGELYAWLGPWAGGITEHHERYDGKGYPARLAGEQITLAGRIVAVADAYETMTAARAYKNPMATAAARQELARCAGKQFDARVVRAFLEVSLPRLLWRVGPLSFLTHLPFLNSLQAVGQSSLMTVASLAAPAAAAGLSAVAVAVLPPVQAAVPERAGAVEESMPTRSETTTTADPADPAAVAPAATTPVPLPPVVPAPEPAGDKARKPEKQSKPAHDDTGGTGRSDRPAGQGPKARQDAVAPKAPVEPEAPVRTEVEAPMRATVDQDDDAANRDGSRNGNGTPSDAVAGVELDGGDVVGADDDSGDGAVGAGSGRG